MNELLAAYAAIVQASSDEKIIVHLTNLVNDAAALKEAIKNVVDLAKTRVTQE